MLATLWVAHLGCTVFMTGLIWVVQWVHYPLFSAVGETSFSGYHHEHTRLITYIVVPVMVTECITAVGLVLWAPPGMIRWVAAVSGALLLVVWTSTGFLQVPQHLALSKGYSPPAVHALVRGNWIRTAAWTLRSAMWLFLTVSCLKVP